MSRSLSLYLDALRALAALVVLLSHFAYARFTDGRYLIIRDLNLGSDAVILFFVLSGFVIAFTRETKDLTWRQFAFNRATRLYSVALPAIGLTVAFDAIGSAMHPAAYEGWWHSRTPLSVAVPVSAVFANEWGPAGLRLGTNGPYWSLSYEAAYYVLFGCAVYLRGVRRCLLLAAGGILFGLKALLLMPAWILGAVAYHWLALSGNSWKRDWRPVARLAAAGTVVAYALCLALDVPETLMRLSTEWLGPHVITRLRFSDEFLWNAIVGFLFAIHLFSVAALLRAQQGRCAGASMIRWLAGASFSVYLVHYPALQIVDSLLPTSPGLGRDVALFVITLAICFLFAQVFERPLASLRRRLQTVAGTCTKRT